MNPKNWRDIMANKALKTSITLILVSLLLTGSAFSLEKTYARIFGDFPGYVDKLMLEWHVPGAALGVVKDGKIIYMRGFGFRDLENKLEADEKTLFCIGSCTKAFTSLGAAVLVDDGKLHWDTPIIEYVPDFRLYDPYATNHATIRDLLCHRTAVASHDELWKKSPFSREELFKRLRYLQPIGEFRSTYEYSNLMSMAAGHIVGRINGSTWERFLKERILSPLGMERTKFSIGQAEPDENFAHPYRFDGTRFERCWYHVMDEIAPAGGVTTCVEDMCQWLLLHLNLGKYGDKILVSEKNIEETHKPQVVRWSDGPEREPFGAYCLGWVYSLYYGHRSLSHDGGTRGYQAVVQLLPEKKLGLVFVSNIYDHYVDYIVINTLIERFLGLKEVDWNKRYKEGIDKSKVEAKPAVPRRKWAVPDGFLEKLAGIYEHPGYGTAAVALKNNILFFTYNTNECEMEYAGFNNFRLKNGWYRGLRLSFHLDLNGKVLSLSIPFQKGIDEIVFRRGG
jgi:CubicO group peptidase (beta-lactamase class C family)